MSGIDDSVPSVFKYHHICQNDSQYICFYDENYLCLCQSNRYRADCFIHNPNLDHCDKCLSGGKCFQGNPKDPGDFICICPDCHYGHRCEFSFQAFSFTLDSLLVNDSKEVKILYLSIVFLLFIIGFFNNFCAFITFKRHTPRKFATGNYLFIVTFLNQAALLCLFCKFIQITFGISDVGFCKAFSYLLSVLTRSIYWLTSCVTIDRFLLILFPTSLALKSSRLAIGVSIAILSIVSIMHVHEIIHYTMIRHFSTDSSICVTNFNTHFVSIYNRISTLIHYLCPFSIQAISITLQIILAARSRAKTVGQKMTFHQVLKNQFRTQKELYIMPMIIILSALPQTILTFSLACMELSDWQRHALLVAYLFSYAPQILGFILYVLPSTNYKKEFSETLLGKRFSQWMLSRNNNNNDKIINAKVKK